MEVMEKRYRSAENILSWDIKPKVKNLNPKPYWLSDSLFWFKREIQQGYEYISIDSVNLTQTPLFDQQRLARALADFTGTPINHEKLPIDTIEYGSDKQLRLGVHLKEKAAQQLILDLENYELVGIDIALPAKDNEGNKLPSVISPDQDREIITRDHNLVLRERVTAKEKILTHDGEKHNGYGNRTGFIHFGGYEDRPLAPAVLWSCDARFLVCQRIDERKVKDMPVLQTVPEDGSVRPLVHSYKMALPGDQHVGEASLCVIDLVSGDIIPCDRAPVELSHFGLIDGGAVRWGRDNCVYFVESSRDLQTFRLVAFDPVLRRSRVLLEESGKGIVWPAAFPISLQYVFEILPESNEFIWYSRSSGWGHLYRYDLASGQLKNPITSGDYVVNYIHHIDSNNGCLYFSACGREPGCNPYYEHLYKVNLDGTNLVLLTPEPSHHNILSFGLSPFYDESPHKNAHGISPGGDVFIDTFSRVDQPSKTVLRSTNDGSELMLLAECDAAPLSDSVLPMDFTAKAADDETDLYGVLYRPGDFDPDKSYPVILFIYGTPQNFMSQRSFCESSNMVSVGYYQSLSELGFVVLTMEPRGTPLRSKAFHDEAYQNLNNGSGIDDQVAAIKQLAKRHSWIDIERVGITGFSGGGFASARAMLTHSDFFKVAVSSAGNHVLELYCAGWVECFQGLLEGDNYAELSINSLAKNLKGKLLLTHGDRDANVHVAHTMQLVDQLVKHHRDFDLLILPNQQHTYPIDPYYVRRMWDYFVLHLLGQEPPENFRITALDVVES